MNPLSVVHYLANHVKKRIPGYIPYYSETTMCSGNEILLPAKQGNCPMVVAAKWTHRNDKLCDQAATLDRSCIQGSLYITSPCIIYSIVKCTNNKDNHLPYLAAHFDVGSLFDPVDWTDPNNPGQTMLLSLGFWHRQGRMVLDVKDYPEIINLEHEFVQFQCPALAFCQLVVITSGQQTTTTIKRLREICSVMEPNGATLRYN
jgi:hypothetical protein